ncbi:uncharacterized protein LOC117148740 [Drosophila mauritiana]|uniref:Uncharacterized protein LOC117148740 n=1 Tax=Drosophila mauritiana TaxID=7226 RepID=A0A6P8KQ36_DROMA|nr:uncharacterized protein LOC117148740 [Drosophila mauritiana]
MRWLSFLLLGVSIMMLMAERTPYVCDGKDDRVCDEYRCMCRRKTSTEPYPRTEYEF